jgi:hypothetical protein
MRAIEPYRRPSSAGGFTPARKKLHEMEAAKVGNALMCPGCRHDSEAPSGRNVPLRSGRTRSRWTIFPIRPRIGADDAAAGANHPRTERGHRAHILERTHIHQCREMTSVPKSIQDAKLTAHRARFRHCRHFEPLAHYLPVFPSNIRANSLCAATQSPSGPSEITSRRGSHAPSRAGFAQLAHHNHCSRLPRHAPIFELPGQGWNRRPCFRSLGNNPFTTTVSSLSVNVALTNHDGRPHLDRERHDDARHGNRGRNAVTVSGGGTKQIDHLVRALPPKVPP